MGAMSRPSRMTCPDVGSISRLSRRTSVDLPEPERPMTTKISPALTLRLTSLTATMFPVCSKISFRPRPCLISSAARSGFGPKIFDRFLTVRISVPETAMGFATAETSSALIAPGWTTPSGANVRFGVILSSQKASTKNRSARLVSLHSPCTRRPRSPWPHTSASFMTELSAQSRGQTSRDS